MLTCKDMKNSLCWLENKWIWFISFSFLCCETLYEWAGSIWFRHQDPKGSKTSSGACFPQSLIRNPSNRSSTQIWKTCHTTICISSQVSKSRINRQWYNSWFAISLGSLALACPFLWIVNCVCWVFLYQLEQREITFYCKKNTLQHIALAKNIWQGERHLKMDKQERN